MQERIRWAPKAPQAKIAQIYQSDARGLYDEELIEEVGIALYARCESVLLVSNAGVRCPRCGNAFRGPWPPQEFLTCPEPGCGWQVTYQVYHNSWRGQDLIGSNAGDAFEAYLDEYARAASPREKMLCIDRLIHAFHQGIRAEGGHRSAANNLIEGRHDQVVAFLDRLAYGEGGTPELRETHAHWQEEMAAAMRFRKGLGEASEAWGRRREK
ncbi:MAG: hypothetical protein ACYC5M_08960 [Anaerolineae bacterium]